jgi:hypothetical protein
VPDIEDNLQNSWSAYKQLKKEASNLRITWLEEVSVAWSAEVKVSVVQEITNLTNREWQCREALQVKYALTYTTRNGLSLIEVPDEQGNWIELSEKNQIEQAYCRSSTPGSRKHLKLLFKQIRYCHQLALLGPQRPRKKFFEGTYRSPPSTDVWAVKLIEHLQQAIVTAPIVDLSPTQYAAGWEKVREKTSAGRSGITDLSPSQYAAGWEKVREKTSAGRSGITIPHMKAHSTSVYLNTIDTVMANIPYWFGFSPLRWQQGLDVMLEKKAGIWQLSTLQAILLYKADFNQNNKR